MNLLERFYHKRTNFIGALKIAQEQDSRLASISEIVESAPEIASFPGPICSGTIVAFRHHKNIYRVHLEDSFSTEQDRYFTLIFPFTYKDEQRDKIFIMPPGTYTFEEKKSSMILTASSDFVPLLDFVDYHKKGNKSKQRFFVFTTSKSIDRRFPLIDKKYFRDEFVSPALLEMEGGQRNLRIFKNREISPKDECDFFILKSSQQ